MDDAASRLGLSLTAAAVLIVYTWRWAEALSVVGDAAEAVNLAWQGRKQRGESLPPYVVVSFTTPDASPARVARLLPGDRHPEFTLNSVLSSTVLDSGDGATVAALLGLPRPFNGMAEVRLLSLARGMQARNGRMPPRGAFPPNSQLKSWPPTQRRTAVDWGAGWMRRLLAIYSVTGQGPVWAEIKAEVEAAIAEPVAGAVGVAGAGGPDVEGCINGSAGGGGGCGSGDGGGGAAPGGCPSSSCSGGSGSGSGGGRGYNGGDDCSDECGRETQAVSRKRPPPEATSAPVPFDPTPRGYLPRSSTQKRARDDQRAFMAGLPSQANGGSAAPATCSVEVLNAEGMLVTVRQIGPFSTEADLAVGVEAAAVDARAAALDDTVSSFYHVVQAAVEPDSPFGHALSRVADPSTFWPAKPSRIVCIYTLEWRRDGGVKGREWRTRVFKAAHMLLRGGRGPPLGMQLPLCPGESLLVFGVPNGGAPFDIDHLLLAVAMRAEAAAPAAEDVRNLAACSWPFMNGGGRSGEMRSAGSTFSKQGTKARGLHSDGAGAMSNKKYTAAAVAAAYALLCKVLLPVVRSISGSLRALLGLNGVDVCSLKNGRGDGLAFGAVVLAAFEAYEAERAAQQQAGDAPGAVAAAARFPADAVGLAALTAGGEALAACGAATYPFTTLFFTTNGGVPPHVDEKDRGGSVIVWEGVGLDPGPPAAWFVAWCCWLAVPVRPGVQLFVRSAELVHGTGWLQPAIRPLRSSGGSSSSSDSANGGSDSSSDSTGGGGDGGESGGGGAGGVLLGMALTTNCEVFHAAYR